MREVGLKDMVPVGQRGSKYMSKKAANRTFPRGSRGYRYVRAFTCRVPVPVPVDVRFGELYSVGKCLL